MTFLYLLLIGKIIFVSCQDVVVKTTMGSILGATQMSRNEIPYISFRGIRFAKVPVGELRLKPPVPEDPWVGILNATEDGPACPQEDFLNQSEDCLRLNVYTHSLTDTLKPVLVYIHGGGFNYHSAQSNVHGPDYLMDYDIVVVTFNYRLGTLGFFSTGDKHAAGNYGLKDQVLALKWVKTHIQHFGGDPNKITISGESAGAASVVFHMISPMSRGLFHGAMILSGSAINPWPVNPNPMELARQQAKILNCSSESSEDIVNCIKQISMEDLIKSYQDMTLWKTERRLNRAVIEVESDGSERFLVKDPLISILEGDVADVPIFIGITKDEMVHRAINILVSPERAEELSQNWTALAPGVAILEQYNLNETIIQKLREIYIGSLDKPITSDSVNELGNLISDSWITFGVIRTAKLLSKRNTKPVYLYQYNYLLKDLQPHLKPSIRGKIAHAHDLYSVFYCPVYFPEKLNSTSSDGRFVTKFTTLWKNFVETGNPTPVASETLDNVIWEPYTPENPKYLDINENIKLVNGSYYEEQMKFWESLFPLP